MKVKSDAGASLIVVTHNPELAKGSDRVMEMRDGDLQVSSLQTT
jgi:ABC-type lipoprotein export system ATPase subunit